MNSFIRDLTPGQQVGALFIVLFGLLLLATAALAMAGLASRPDGPAGEARREQLRHLGRLLRVSWGMVTVFWVAWASGPVMATVLFGFVSFFALREFLTLSPTRRGDHRSLVLAFFVVLPLQYLLVGTRHFDAFTVFIPVYAFLALPAFSALRDDPARFLERSAKLQWGVMVCVYGMSHVPALLLLEFAGHTGRSAFVVFWLVAVVQTGMLVQHLLNRLGRYPAALPAISAAFSWRAFAFGILAGGIVGGLLSPLTPFKPAQGLALGLMACTAGAFGHLVMKAIKRDRGVTSWGGQGASVTGAGGLLDRVDALCFAAPVFFHSVRWYFGL